MATGALKESFQFKICHPDRSGAERAKWRDLLFQTVQTGAVGELNIDAESGEVFCTNKYRRVAPCSAEKRSSAEKQVQV
jgi:hypothetical protein